MKVRHDANGVHLFDRRTGLNILLDECAVPAEEKDPAPRFVSMALTNACDLQCRFCYAPKHPARLDTRWVITWATELDKSGCVGLGFGGGEPSLHPDFVRICQEVSARTQMAVTFTTHGHRLTESMAEVLSGCVHFLRVSMDGTGSTYEAIRNRSFSVLVDKLQLAREIAPFGVNYVVNAETIGDLDAAAAMAFELGAFELLLLPERPVGTNRGIDISTMEILLDWINRNGHYRLAISESPHLQGLPVVHPFSDEHSLIAYAHIDASGYLRTSSFSNEAVQIHSSVMAAVSQLCAKTGGAL